jgi:hypothetical protein
MINTLENSSDGIGNTEAYFAKVRSIISVNDGKRRCDDSIKQVQNSQPPFDSTEPTQMQIVEPKFDITNIDKSYCIIAADIPVTALGIDAGLTDPDHLLKVFVGYKSSNQIFRQTELESNGKDTGYKSNYLVWEGFAYSRSKCNNELQRKRGVHTLWDNVWKYMPAVCGTYINLVDLKNGAVVHAKFQVCVPFTNLLMFSFFSYLGKFPSFLASVTLKDVLLRSPELGIRSVQSSGCYGKQEILTG